ncbi:uroporphyrinogen-III C-methyltransferase [Mobilicoccus caccae]|uniref:uroporphyrinogen-III C-methyltransferase n=1 Tax=Mobilicoccus caccae TaxID=1859295 RepID=A0ABQ6ITA3_9MICO|nr:uroporphyrinogen-III C-methyltransferase [Mobilicoccus caccae]GMA41127.1 uroporphyrinogen-III C-methyltransferase [Mobilicoccus caccae]
MSTATHSLPPAGADAAAPVLFGLSLAGRRVVAVGGGRVTARRVRDLLAEGARVEVIAPELDPSLSSLVNGEDSDVHADAALSWTSRPYAGNTDLDGAWLVHVATGDPVVDAQVAADAEAHRIWCIAAGSATTGSARVPARGTVPTAAGPVRVAVHAADDPRRAAHVRDELQTHLARSAAAHLSSGVVDLRARRARGGWVALVGAGPGDADLLTGRAMQLLAGADVVVTDRLVPHSVLEALPEDVRIIDVGKRPDHHPVPQDRINRILVEQARAGHGVVRLKGGDPYVLGRGGEERLECEAAGLPVEVVPGITSAVSVPAAAGIPVTHRGLARGFTVVTGHDDIPHLPTGGDHTVVLLMGVATLHRTVALLREHGRAASTPLAIVERGWTADQRVTLGTLADIADRAEAAGVRSPAVVVVGDVVTLAHGWTGALTGGASRPVTSRAHARARREGSEGAA